MGGVPAASGDGFQLSVVRAALKIGDYKDLWSQHFRS